MTTATTWQVRDTYYQAQLFRHGHGLDYDNPPRLTEAEAESDLRESLAMMSSGERQQAKVESYVGRFRVLAVDVNGQIGQAESY